MHLLVITVLLLLNCNDVFAYTKRDLLQKRADVITLKNVLVKDYKWIPYPAYQDRRGWDIFLGKYKLAFIEKGQQALGYQWKVIKATDYLEFERTGSRSTMEGPFNQNIQAIVDLFMAELAEGEGRFIDQLANGVFESCQMTSWAAAAHLKLQLNKSSFPNHNEQIIDLVSGDVGSLFSWIYYYFHQQFDQLNPTIAARVKKEIQDRILDPYMNLNHLWWMAFNYKPGDMVNNWNPWCNSNVLQCFALMEENPEKLALAVYRTMVSVDHFINYTNEDGACEEGPSYWGHAAGKLYDYLQILYDITGGKISVFNEPIIQNMGVYISRAYVGDNWVVNFADASARLKPEASLIYRYGKAIRNPEMMEFASYLNGLEKKSEIPSATRDILRLFQMIEYEVEDQKPALLHQTPYYTWYPQTQCCFIRQGDLFFAAKGGYNNESHNHNDVGSFNLYINNVPVLIDVGVGTYTRQTFGPERYSIWTMQSRYHNVPEINGFTQKFGSQYKAKEVDYNTKLKRLSLNLAGAYPEEAGITYWNRCYQLNKNSLTIKDDFFIHNPQKENAINFLTWGKVSLVGAGKITIEAQKHMIELSYSSKQFEVLTEKIELADARLSNVWGKELYRLTLVARDKKPKDKYQFILKKIL